MGIQVQCCAFWSWNLLDVYKMKCNYKTTNWTGGNNYKRDRTEPAHVFNEWQKEDCPK